jgi:hypothetical protein
MSSNILNGVTVLSLTFWGLATALVLVAADPSANNQQLNYHNAEDNVRALLKRQFDEKVRAKF